jgi:hypothetical protein
MKIDETNESIGTAGNYLIHNKRDPIPLTELICNC